MPRTELRVHETRKRFPLVWQPSDKKLPPRQVVEGWLWMAFYSFAKSLARAPGVWT
jgi:hypothetical protein